MAPSAFTSQNLQNTWAFGPPFEVPMSQRCPTEESVRHLDAAGFANVLAELRGLAK